MEYTGQDLPGTDATGAFPAFGRPGADDVQYADSGFLPDGAMPANARPAYSSRLTDDVRVSMGGGRLAEISHLAEVSHLAADAGRSDGDWPVNDNRLPDPSQLTEMSSLPGNNWLMDNGSPTENIYPTDADDLEDASDPAGGGEFFPRDGWYPDRGAESPDRGGWYPDRDGTAPAVDWYAGYEQYAGERAGQAPEPAGERFLTRVYARPADPRQGLPDGNPGRPPDGNPGRPPDDDTERLPLADYPAMSSLIRRLARLRLDRWLIAGGSLAAAVAVIVAFATAGGSGAMPRGTAATPGSGTAQTGTTHVVQPVCVSPGTGH
jgi:hypothetical protein